MIRFDFNQAAWIAATCIASFAVLSQWRILRRMRQATQRDLERIFEQVDMMRLDAQQASLAAPAQLEAPAAIVPQVATPDSAIGYAAALELAAHGAEAGEITARCGLSAAEARILVAMRGLQGKARSVH